MKIEIVPTQENWPAELEAIASSLGQALASLAERIDHIGSTSVPGLALDGMVFRPPDGARPANLKVRVHVRVSGRAPLQFNGVWGTLPASGQGMGIGLFSFPNGSCPMPHLIPICPQKVSFRC